jgi:hypothetical protein
MNQADTILKLANNFYRHSRMIKVSKIIKLPDGKFRVVSQKGKNLGTYKSKSSAEKRLQQVEYFKHLDSLDARDNKEEIDLSKLDDFTLSAVLRELNKLKNKKPFKLFLKTFKIHFDKSIKNNVNYPEKVALQMSFMQLNRLYHVKIDGKLVKTAATLNLGDPVLVGKYLSDIVKFILNRISPAKRQGAINRLKQKFYYLNENELSSKKMPASSAIGQSITFVKTVLFQHDASYIRKIINSLIKSL